MKAVALLSTLQSADIVLPTTDGRQIRLRRITEPTVEQKTLLRQLGIRLPEHLQSFSIANVVQTQLLSKLILNGLTPVPALFRDELGLKQGASTKKQTNSDWRGAEEQQVPSTRTEVLARDDKNK